MNEATLPAVPPTGDKLVRSDLVIKFLIWLIPLIFVAGGLYKMIVAASEISTTALTEVRTESGENARMHSDVNLKWGVIDTRLSTVERVQQEMLSEQKKQGENIAAICQVTRAKCK